MWNKAYLVSVPYSLLLTMDWLNMMLRYVCLLVCLEMINDWNFKSTQQLCVRTPCSCSCLDLSECMVRLKFFVFLHIYQESLPFHFILCLKSIMRQCDFEPRLFINAGCHRRKAWRGRPECWWSFSHIKLFPALCGIKWNRPRHAQEIPSHLLDTDTAYWSGKKNKNIHSHPFR